MLSMQLAYLVCATPCHPQLYLQLYMYHFDILFLYTFNILARLSLMLRSSNFCFGPKSTLSVILYISCPNFSRILGNNSFQPLFVLEFIVILNPTSLKLYSILQYVSLFFDYLHLCQNVHGCLKPLAFIIPGQQLLFT